MPPSRQSVGRWKPPPVDLGVGEELRDVGLACGAGLDGPALAQGAAGIVGPHLHVPNALHTRLDRSSMLPHLTIECQIGTSQRSC